MVNYRELTNSEPGVPTLSPYQEEWVVFLLCVSVCKAGCFAAGVTLNF